MRAISDGISGAARPHPTPSLSRFSERRPAIRPSGIASTPVGCAQRGDGEEGSSISSDIGPELKKPGFAPGFAADDVLSISTGIVRQEKGATLPLGVSFPIAMAPRIWERLEGLRVLNNLSQAEIARRLGHDNNGFVANVLIGKRIIPLEAIGRWVDAFDPQTPELRLDLITTAIQEFHSPYIVELRNATANLVEKLRVFAESLREVGAPVPDDVSEAIDRADKSVRFE
jgi:hypothetical protein